MLKKSLLGLSLSTAIAAAFLGLSGCATVATVTSPGKAIAKINPASGSDVHGSVTFEQRGDKVQVIADVSGFAPNTVHGFHIHAIGDCSKWDATSAGGHFNPEHEPHGKGEDRHVGDMPNLVADSNGVAKMSVELDKMTLKNNSKDDIIGKAVIVHAWPDDYKSQPTGNAGARVGCGVIKAE
jgi:Cu-Zn family superoxide dismutase